MPVGATHLERSRRAVRAGRAAGCLAEGREEIHVWRSSSLPRGSAVEAHASSAAAEAAGAAAAASAGDAADVPMLEGAVGARNHDSNALPLPICALAALAAFWARAASGSSKLLLALLLLWRAAFWFVRSAEREPTRSNQSVFGACTKRRTRA